ncbi:MAG: transglutaminase domain-containing protein [Lachnospiraceae bacterium]
MKKKLLYKMIITICIFFSFFLVVIKGNAEGNTQDDTWVNDSVLLVQDGKMVCQYFQSGQGTAALSTDDWETVLIQRIRTAFINCETIISLSDLQLDKDNDYEKMREIYRTAITGDFFYVTGSYSWSYSSSTNYINSIKVKYQNSYCDDDGNPNVRQIQKDADLFQYQTEKALNCVDNVQDSIEIALLLHDFLVRECDYDEENYLNNSIPDKSYNAYGVLVDGQAVCNGYAIAYSYLLQQCGIESYVLSSDSMNHAWNLIMLDDSWYHVDVTWDDPVFTSGNTYFSQYNADYADEGFIYHKYFLCSDEEFTNLNHKGWKIQTGSSDLPEADNSANFDKYLFKSKSVASYFKINNKMYCYDLSTKKLIENTDLLGTDSVVIDLQTNQPLYGFGYENVFYFNTLNTVYAFRPDTGEYGIIYQTEDDYSMITELSIKNGYLIYVITKNDDSSKRLKQYISTLSEYKQPESVALSRVVPYTNKLKLVWNTLEKSDGYVIYHSTDPCGKYSVVKNISDYQTSSYSHLISDHERHYYKIRTYRLYGTQKVYSEYSEILSAKLLPDVPEKLSVEPVAYNKLQISWEPSEGADGYVIYKKTRGENSFTILKAVDSGMTFYTERVSALEEHIYKVRAYYIENGKKIYSLYSDEVSGKVISGPPQSVAVKRVTDYKNRISWQIVQDADGYVIYRSTDGENYSVLKLINDKAVTSYDNTVGSDEHYYYKMKAFQIVNGKKVYSQYTTAVSDRE